MSRGTVSRGTLNRGPLTALFVLTVLLAALLLFLVQPMAARMLLPSYGGSPSVWTTCMLFFQVILLAGYAGAHALTRYFSLKWQVIVQAIAAIAALGVLPFRPERMTAPSDLQAPVRALLASLLVSVGPPLLVLAATAPLLQRWFSSTGARNPYALYAASNLGSLAALLGYPLIVERFLPIAGGGRMSSQTMLWSLGYAGFVLAALSTGVLCALRRPADGLRGTAVQVEDGGSETISWRTRLLWVALAFIPSSAMLGVTLYLTTDVAAVPLLWVLPLSIYLLTYVIAFSGALFSARARFPVLPARITVFVLCAVVALMPFYRYRPHPALAMLVHLSAFFFLALVLHGDLSRARPHRERLTEFYLWIAAGGALGGVFNALVAPWIFDQVLEYPIVLVAGCLLATRSWIPAALLAACFAAAAFFAAAPGRTIHAERTFFGVVKVMRNEGVSFVLLDDTGAEKGKEMSIPGNVLLHGTTRHGIQMLDPVLRFHASSYYHMSGPIGSIFRAYGATPRLSDIGVVGLGTGTVAAYGQKWQRFTFYEIDAAVSRVARNPNFFTYLSDSRAEVTVDLTDGRVGLDRGAPARFDLLIVDGFSSDSIPIHLMTKEAFEVYVEALRPEGILAIHATNKYFDLIPVVRAIAGSLGLDGVVWRDLSITDRERVEGKNTSDWVILARRPGSLDPLRQQTPRWTPLAAEPEDDRYLWTDDHASPLSVMKW